MSAVLTREAHVRTNPGREEPTGLRAEAVAPARERNSPERAGPGPAEAQAGGRLTLEQRLDSVWEGLRAGGASGCPVCHGQIGPAAGSAFHCGGCGSVLS